MTTEQHLQLHDQMIASIERNLSALVEAQQKSEKEIETSRQVVIRLGQVADRTLIMVQELATRQLQADERGIQADERQRQADERQRRLDERMDKLAESLQRYLDSESRRNGGE